ncbi:MAG: hypothetical protein E7637_08745 [Ruminococcaceae bacterium]|nr:hypothetical protein [Oscillospiraceae bacterium]
MEKTVRKWRFMGVAVLFCVISVIYLGRLFYIQISGRVRGTEQKNEIRTVTIQAVRGEIFDRNGELLVGNRYTYDLVLSYKTFSSMDVREANRECLQILQGLSENPEEGSNLREERYFPFEGTYPYYRYSEAALDGESVVYFRLQRVLSDLKLDGDLTAKELAEYYIDAHGLLMKQNNGKRYFDDDQVDALIRLYYDMDAQRFRALGEYVFAENVNLSAMTYIKELSVSLAVFHMNAERVYEYPGYASHILGRVGPIYAETWSYYKEQGYQMNAIVGIDGCEAAFESYLRGIDGEMEIELDASGTLLRSTVKKEPVAGKDVYLTIDVDLQIAAEDGLAENVALVVEKSNGYASKGSDCNAGAAVVMDPNDFSILALASYPTYDLSTYSLLYNDLLADPAGPLRNRALNESYAPGSTYKLGVAAAAMCEGLLEAGERVLCNRVSPYGSNPTCSTYSQHPNEYLNVREAIADSCNLFFYEIGHRFDINEKLSDMGAFMSKLGFGRATGVELPEAIGSVSDPNDWGSTDSTWKSLFAAIGQANDATPLQLSCYLGTLLGGTRYAAHLLYGVSEFGSDGITQKNEPVVLDTVEIPTWVLDEIVGGMKQVVTDNATVRSNFSEVRKKMTVGAKTGTAQVGGDNPDNALFVCAAPIESPELVISVVLEKGAGGSAASLTAARILEAYLKKQP